MTTWGHGEASPHMTAQHSSLAIAKREELGKATAVLVWGPDSAMYPWSQRARSHAHARW